MVIPVVLAGGVGSRLWPVSRALLPKQFVHLPGRANTLFQDTVLRLQDAAGLQNPLVICNEDHRFLAAEQLRQLDATAASIILEPHSRNTAPAAALAALHATAENQDPLLLLLPADHIIKDSMALLDTLAIGIELAEEGNLLTFGVMPDSANTGYGYIERGEPLQLQKAVNAAEQGPWRVKKFTEKPALKLATQFLEGKRHLWNSGMFMFRASVYLNQLNQFAPDIYRACLRSFEARTSDSQFVTIPQDQFALCRSESIDFAVMEKTEKAAVIPLNAGWDDLGSWDAMWQTQAKNEHGNAISGDVFASEVQRCLIHSESRLVAAVGLSDAVIVETADAVLVSSRERAQGVKEIVNLLESVHREEVRNPTKVTRPWGSFEMLMRRPGYELRHLVLVPGAELSINRQRLSVEQVTLLKGSLEINIAGNTISLEAGDSTSIPAAVNYQLVNRNEAAVELIQVQVGETLEESEDLRFNNSASAGRTKT